MKGPKMLMKKLSLTFALVALFCGSAFANANKLTAAMEAGNTAAVYAGQKYEELLDKVEFWDLENGNTPVYFGEMTWPNGEHLRCLALAFMHSPEYGKVHYVFKSWPKDKRGFCNFDEPDILVSLNKPACLPDPTFNPHSMKGTNEMTPSVIGAPMKDLDGNYSRILDFHQFGVTKPNKYGKTYRYGRAGLFEKCTHPQVHAGVVKKEGAGYANGQNGNSMREIEITGDSFWMQTNSRGYHVLLKRPTNTFVDTLNEEPDYPGTAEILNALSAIRASW